MSKLILFLFLFALIASFGKLTNGQFEDAETAEGNAENVQQTLSRLLESAGEGDIDGLINALDSGEDINIVNVNGWSAACFAVAAGKMDALHYLIEMRIDLNHANNDGFTPLMLASLQGDKEMVELMLANNADPSITSPEGVNAYSVAIQSGRKVVALIIAEACVIRGMANDDVGLIMQSVRDGGYVNIPSPSGWTPTMYMSSRGHEEELKELILHGAIVDQSENDGWSALHFAAFNGFENCVEILLKAGSNNFPTKDGRTPIDIASAAGFTGIVNMITESIQQRHTDL